MISNSMFFLVHSPSLDLVGGLEHLDYFSNILGMSSSQLTFIFFRGVGIPPTRDVSSIISLRKDSPHLAIVLEETEGRLPGDFMVIVLGEFPTHMQPMVLVGSPILQQMSGLLWIIWWLQTIYTICNPWCWYMNPNITGWWIVWANAGIHIPAPWVAYGL